MSFTPAPVPISVTGTPNFSSMFFMNDFDSESNSSIDCTPAHEGNLTSSFVIYIWFALLSMIARRAKS